eukprot:scaffold581_cov96-Skeletonema_dohrnii-CCMP3373.AAC.3
MEAPPVPRTPLHCILPGPRGPIAVVVYCCHRYCMAIKADIMLAFRRAGAGKDLFLLSRMLPAACTTYTRIPV